MEDIDRRRRGDRILSENITSEDIFAFLARPAQNTLYQICRSPRKPIESEVISAASKFFSVFFLKESLIEFDPRVVLIACVNLAAKTEEYHAVSLTDIISSFSDSASLKTQVPLVEMTLLAALEYDLVIEQPWPVMLFWVEKIRTDESTAHSKIYDISCGIMHVWQWTDAVHLFPFPQLATAAVLKATQNYSKSHNSAAAEDSDMLVMKLLDVMKETIPDVNVEKLLQSVEDVVNRFGAFEKIIKDPIIESTVGFRELVALTDYTKSPKISG